MNKKILSVVLAVFAAISSFTMTAFANEDFELIEGDGVINIDNDVAQPIFTIINRLNGYIYFSGDTGTATTEISGASVVDKITADVTLFYKKGNTWYEMEYWHYSTNGNTLYKEDDFYAEENMSYKLVITAYVYNGDTCEMGSKVVNKTY